MPTIKEVAARAGVSIATVSRVLSDKPHVRPEVRLKVLDAVEELGYRPHRGASQLRSRKSSAIGLVVSDIRNPFFAEVSHAVEEAAQAHGYSVFLCNTDEDPAKERRYLEVLEDQRVAGILLSPSQELVETFDEVVSSTLPIVVYDRAVRSDRVDQIGIDNALAAEEATEQLLDGGCRRIGALFGSGANTAVGRHEGFVRALQARGLEPDESLVHFVPPRSQRGTAHTRGLLEREDPPDALLVGSGGLAGGVVRAIREHGWRIPDDIQLACFDRAEWIDILGAPVHVVEQPTQEIGRAAVELLVERIAEPDRAARRLFLRHTLTAPEVAP